MSACCLLRRIVQRFIWPAHASCYLVRRGFFGHGPSPTTTKKTVPRLEEPRYGRSWPQHRRGGPAVRPALGARLRCRSLPSPPTYMPTNFCSFRLAPLPTNVNCTHAIRRQSELINPSLETIITSRPLKLIIIYYIYYTY